MAWTGSVEDRLEIRELIDAYSDAVSQRDADAWGATWAEDARWDLAHLGIAVEGRDKIVEAWKQGMALFPFVTMMAVPGKIEVDGDRANVRCYTAEVAVTQEGNEIRPRGQYDDVCIKRNGKWLFLHRKFQVLHGE